jgi:hypothetical protein
MLVAVGMYLPIETTFRWVGWRPDPSRGVSHNPIISADGSHVVFLRSSSGDDPVNRLWRYDVERAREVELVDPWAEPPPEPPSLPAPERRRVAAVGPVG